MSRTDIDDMLLNQAIGFLQRHRGQHLAGNTRQLLSRAVCDLQARHDFSAEHLEDIVIRAYGEVESVGQREYIDISRTTAVSSSSATPARA